MVHKKLFITKIKKNNMSTITFISIMYYIIAGLICYGKCIGEQYEWYDRVIAFVLGFVLTPLLIGQYIKRNL